MSPATAIILAILSAVVLLTIKSYADKLKKGCCGGGCDDLERVKAADGNVKNYPYHKTVSVTGMTCRNCSQRVENAFNRQEGMLARVDLNAGRADIYSKQPLDADGIRRTIAQAGYTPGDVRDA